MFPIITWDDHRISESPTTELAFKSYRSKRSVCETRYFFWKYVTGLQMIFVQFSITIVSFATVNDCKFGMAAI